ncbi:hypothetical protein Tco_0999308 [Tanacetum coccineum]
MGENAFEHIENFLEVVGPLKIKGEDGSKYMLKFVLDRKELTLTLDDFRRIFQLPQATDNNHERFVAAPKFSEMVPFFLNDLVFTLELRSPSNFKTTGLVQPWQTLGNMFPRYSQSSLWDTAYPEISRRVRDKYHNLEHDEMVKSIFNTGKNNAGVGMKIPSWMITDEMKLTENYQMTTSAPRSPNPDVDEGESSAQRKSTAIRLRIPPRRSTRLTSPTLVPTIAEVEDMTLQDTIQLSIVEQKSRDDFEA